MGANPGWSYGYVPTAAEWNNAFAGKQDNLAFTPLNIAGGTMTGLLGTFASASGSSGFNIPPGIAPTSPNAGDLWTTTTGFFIELGGVPIPIVPGRFALKKNVSFQMGSTDISLPVNLPPGITSFIVAGISIGNASGTLTSGSIGIFTGSAAGGTAICSSQTLNVTSISANTNGNTQNLTVNNATTQSYNSANLFIRIVTGGIPATADIIAHINLQ